MQKALVEGVLNDVRRGKRGESGFKPATYAAVLPLVQDACTSGHVLDVQKCKNKLSDLKALYVIWRTLQELSGWGLDPDTRLIVADDEQWTTYLKVSFFIQLITIIYRL
jgi:hypothetical protein